MANPLDQLLAPTEAPATTYRWGHVVDPARPIQVILDNETEPIEAATLTGASLGDRVLVALNGRRATILGKAGGARLEDLANVSTTAPSTGDRLRWDGAAWVPEPEPAWQSWTPVIKGTTTDPTMGNSTLVGRYLQVGKTVSLRLYLQIGSTFTPGAGVYMIPTLPVAPRSDYWQPLLVAAGLSSPAGDFAGVAKIEGSAGIVRIHFYRGDTTVSLGAIGADNFSTGNRLLISGTYEAA